MPVCKGCVTTVITKSSKIFCIGHLEGHIDKKVALLRSEGFTDVQPMYAQKMTADEIKYTLNGHPGCLFFVGGAMEKAHGALMKDLYAFLPVEAPTVACYVLTQSDFPSETGSPPSAEEVAAASCSCIKKLVQEWEAKG
jgi:hypothetical protein